MTLLLRHYYVIITSLLHHYYGNNGAIITVIMGLLLPIITKSIMGNNESIITHYEPTQLADEVTSDSIPHMTVLRVLTKLLRAAVAFYKTGV